MGNNSKAELRKNRIINIIYFVIIIGFAYLFMKYCLGIFAPFLVAFFIAIIVQKPSNFLVKKTKIGKGIVSTVMVLLLLAILVFLISLLGVKIVDAVKNLVNFLREKISDFPTLIDNVKGAILKSAKVLPDSIESRVTQSVTTWFDTIRDKSASEIAGLIVNSASGGEKFKLSSLTTPLGGLLSTAKQIPLIFVAIMITIISSCFMAVDYDRIVNFIKNQLGPKHRENLSRSKRIVFMSLGKLLRSYVLIILITGTELFIGLGILSLIGIYKDGHIFLLSVIVAVFDILPVIGTGTFMVPWALYSLITGNIGLAIGLFVVYAIIYVVRQVIEPKLVSGTVDLPPFLTLMGMYVGTQLFGVIGIFGVPIMIIIIKLLNDEGIIHVWNSVPDEQSEKAVEENNS